MLNSLIESINNFNLVLNSVELLYLKIQHRKEPFRTNERKIECKRKNSYECKFEQINQILTKFGPNLSITRNFEFPVNHIK